MSKWFSTVVVGVASGVAAAYFLTTEKGKEVKERANKAYRAYRENPEEYHQRAKESAQKYSNLAVDTFNDYKGKFESGELTKDDLVSAVREKGDEVVAKAGDVFGQVKAKFNDVSKNAKDVVEADDVKAEVDDIVINFEDIKKAEEVSEASAEDVTVDEETTDAPEDKD